MNWHVSHRADPQAVDIANRHYSRQKPGTPQFVPPGRCFVLVNEGATWVTSWPFPQYVKHRWAGAWINSTFRRENGCQASLLITQAIAATRWKWPDVPELGMISFIDPAKVQPRKIRGRSTWGHCYFEAGFTHVGYTKEGLWAMQLLPDRMPEPEMPIGAQAELAKEPS